MARQAFSTVSYKQQDITNYMAQRYVNNTEAFEFGDFVTNISQMAYGVKGACNLRVSNVRVPNFSKTSYIDAGTGINLLDEFSDVNNFGKVSLKENARAITRNYKSSSTGVREAVGLSRVNKYGQTTQFADIDALGSTSPFTGNIKIQKGLRGQEFKETLRHELVHRFLTPRSGPFKEVRQKIRWQGYDKSNLLRYSEEAIAEIYGTRSITKGLVFPIKNGYVTTGNLLKEGAIVGGGAYIGYKFIDNRFEGDK